MSIIVYCTIISRNYDFLERSMEEIELDAGRK
jgi:hypothetical protein